MSNATGSKKLEAEVRKLRKTIEKVNKPSRRLLLAVATGAASAIGATIIGTIIVIYAFQFIEGSPIADFFERAGIVENLPAE